MGEIEGWAHTGGGRLLPNGLLPNAGSLIDNLDSERWLIAEERTAELITCIQPNQPSEERRNAVADYVQRLIMKCFPCQVFTFGSVPLKTYLPDGDIDLTAFSNNPNLKDSWATEVCDLLQTEEKNENAEFHVKEVQYIQAEVKIIKCLVENIVVDISFNQLGGLCTLCFLEEVDHLINHNHLFKRSIILIKAWCYYESRILGAHHGLISTYALETLVLYIFHVFNNSFAGPLEVLYRFLEFFSNFDWDNFCVSLWGPVPINSLPDVTAESPRKDSGDLLLSKLFLDACSTVYAVFPGGQDNQGLPFISKHFNVVDPLRVSNNLGRSVSKGNFFRIRSAFSLGAKRLKTFLDCPKEDIADEVTKFFTNTWDRHGNGIRPDAPITDSLILKTNTCESVSQESDFDFDHTPSQPNIKPGFLVNDIQRSPFARTRSSPELTDTYQYVLFQQTHNKPLQNGDKKKNTEPETENHAPPQQSAESSTESNMFHNEDMRQEEQDLVNMMASSGFNGHLPFPISPSFLASLGYTQNMIPANMPFGMQFPHYFPVTSNSEDLVNENSLESVEVNSVDDNKPQSSSMGMNYIPPPRRVGGSGGLVRSQHKNNKEKRERLRDNNDKLNDPYSDERATSSRFSSTAHSNDTSAVNKSTKEGDQDNESVIPMGPMIIGSNPRHQMSENLGDASTPLTFYPTGPPVPFLTMLPFYNVPSENGSTMENGQRFNHGAGPGETPDNKHRCDILNSDFASHWRNLQFGRLCQSPRHHGPSVYPPPMMVPPMYLQGRVPWDGPGRPFPNMNVVTNYGPRLVPVAPNLHPNVYQHYVEDMPRYRSGTGTYLPKSVGLRDRPRRGNFDGDRDGNNSKPRGSGRNHNRNFDKQTSRLDRLGGSSGSRSMNSQRHESFSTYQTQNGVLHPGSSQGGPANAGYGMHPLPGVPPNGSNGPGIVMVYPFEQQGEFGSGFPGVTEQSPRGEGSRSRGILEEHRLYSPDQPSSPRH